MKKHEIRTVPIDDCHPNDYNSNKMPDAKFEALVDTIRRNGQTHPIQVVVDKRGGYRIVGGEHKWRAMKALKYKEVEIIQRDFEDETEEKLGSLEDNIHGNTIPVKEALIIASATEKYKLPQLRKRLGEGESELKDKLLLVSDHEKLQKIAESANQEHTVEIGFIVDGNPKDNADHFVKQMTTFARTIGATAVKPPVIKLSKTREAVTLLAFNVSELQKNVIEQAVNSVVKSEGVNKARAVELIMADYLASNGIRPGAKKLSPKPSRKARKNDSK